MLSSSALSAITHYNDGAIERDVEAPIEEGPRRATPRFELKTV
jgi:hypothetical protein